jgi:hypothetical protein
MAIGSNVVKASMLFTGSWVVGAAIAAGSLVTVEPLRMTLAGPHVAVATISADAPNTVAVQAMPASVDPGVVNSPSAGIVVTNPTGPTSGQPSVQPNAGQPNLPAASNVNPTTNPSSGVPGASVPSGLPSGAPNPASVLPGGTLPSIPSGASLPGGSLPSVPSGATIPSGGLPIIPSGSNVPAGLPAGAGIPALTQPSGGAGLPTSGIPAMPALPAGGGIPALVPSQPAIPATSGGMSIVPGPNGPDIAISLPGSGIVPPTNIKVPVIPQNSVPAFNPGMFGR